MNRRNFIGAGLGVAATSFLGCTAAAQDSIGQPRTTAGKSPEAIGRRPLTASELAELNSAVRAIEVKGQRLPDAVPVFSGVEAPPKRN